MLAILMTILIGFDYLKVEVPAERSGLGGAGTCIIDGYTTVDNPAGLVVDTGKMLSTSLVQYLAGTYFGLVCYQNPPYGVALNYFNSGTMKKTDEGGQELGTFMAQFINATLARGFTYRNLAFGFSINLIYQHIDKYTSIAPSINTGLLYQHNFLRLGLAIKSLGYEVKPYRDNRETLPATIAFGGGIERDLFSGYLELEKTLKEPIVFSFGVKGRVESGFYLLIGYNSKLGQIRTNSTIDFLSGGSIGLSLQVSRFYFAYSIAPHADLGLTNRLSFAVTL